MILFICNFGDYIMTKHLRIQVWLQPKANADYYNCARFIYEIDARTFCVNDIILRHKIGVLVEGLTYKITDCNGIVIFVSGIKDNEIFTKIDKIGEPIYIEEYDGNKY